MDHNRPDSTGHDVEATGRIQGPMAGRSLTRALRHRNYRLFFGGQSVSLIGTWITRVATSWLVYRLTGSELLLGMVGFCRPDSDVAARAVGRRARRPLGPPPHPAGHAVALDAPVAGCWPA